MWRGSESAANSQSHQPANRIHSVAHSIKSNLLQCCGSQHSGTFLQVPWGPSTDPYSTPAATMYSSSPYSSPSPGEVILTRLAKYPGTGGIEYVFARANSHQNPARIFSSPPKSILVFWYADVDDVSIRQIGWYNVGSAGGLLSMESYNNFGFFHWAGNIPSFRHASKELAKMGLAFTLSLTAMLGMSSKPGALLSRIQLYIFWRYYASVDLHCFAGGETEWQNFLSEGAYRSSRVIFAAFTLPLCKPRARVYIGIFAQLFEAVPSAFGNRLFFSDRAVICVSPVDRHYRIRGNPLVKSPWRWTCTWKTCDFVAASVVGLSTRH